MISKDEAKGLLEKYVGDEYQKYHALMVASAMEGYAEKLLGEGSLEKREEGKDDEYYKQLWFLSGYLHDIDFHLHPTLHPGESLKWFREWNLPEELIHAVEAHADGYNGFTVKPETQMAKCLVACDEICGIFYAYRRLNPVKYADIKASSIKKRLRELSFAPKIDRGHIHNAVENFGVTIDQHIDNLVKFLSRLD